MKKDRNILYTSRFLIIFTLIGLSVIAVSANLPAKKQQNDIYKQLDKLIDQFDINSLKIVNRTSAFNLIQREKAPEGHIRLTLRNDYDKSITAYTVSIGINSIMVDTILSMHDESVKPGESRDVFLPIEIDPELESKGIDILAVIFEDGTAEGYVNSIKDIQDYRTGDKMQMERFSSILNDAPTPFAATLQNKLSEIQTEVSSASNDREKDLPHRVKLGIQDTKQRLSHLIEKFADKDESEVKTKLVILGEYVKEKTLMLRKYSEAIQIRNQ